MTVTPLRRLSGRPWLLKFRRMLGLFTYFYACLHVTTWVWFDQWFDPAAMVRDVIKRPFITVGFAAFLLLTPLALTSTNGMVRRLGGKAWRALHRLVYLVAPLALLHFFWMRAGKNDFAEVAVYAVILGALLLDRLSRYFKPKTPPAPTR